MAALKAAAIGRPRASSNILKNERRGERVGGYQKMRAVVSREPLGGVEGVGIGRTAFFFSGWHCVAVKPGVAANQRPFLAD